MTPKNARPLPLDGRDRLLGSPSPKGRGVHGLIRAAGVLLALCTLGLATACGGKKAPPPQTVPVTAAEAVTKDVRLVVGAIGTVEAYNTVALKALIGGQLMRVHFKEGQDVRKGDLLFTIDPRPYQAALDQAKAQLARDKAQLVSAEAQARRYADLVKKDYVTQQQFDDATANAGALQATVKADEANVEDAVLNLAYCSIRASMDGRLGNLLVHEGNLVKANDVPLVTLNQVAPVYVAFSVPEQQLAEIRRQAIGESLTVKAAFPDAPSEQFTGQLSFIDNAVDSATGTILLKATFPNEDKALWPGQFVNVTLDLSVLKDAILVPTQAVQQGQQGPYVYVVGPDGTAELRPVKTGQTRDGEVVVLDGIKGGEKVVTDGQLRLFPGARVEIKADASPGGGPVAQPAQGGTR